MNSTIIIIINLNNKLYYKALIIIRYIYYTILFKCYKALLAKW